MILDTLTAYGTAIIVGAAIVIATGLIWPGSELRPIPYIVPPLAIGAALYVIWRRTR